MLNKENMFIGDIKKCTKLKKHIVCNYSGAEVGYVEEADEIIHYNAVLLKTNGGKYIDIENLYLFDLATIKLLPKLSWLKTMGALMATAPQREGECFVDANSLRPYESLQKTKRL